jgi:hypothetical protein
MSRGGDTRFQKGRSGNPNGRPRKRPVAASAFDVVLDQTLTVTQNGVERELTVDEALQLQTYQAALKGSRLAVRAVLRMIEKREVALAKLRPADAKPPAFEVEHEADNAEEAMGILGISDIRSHTEPGTYYGPVKLETWATQAALSRPGRRQYSEKQVKEIKWSTVEPDGLKWPRGSRE